MSKVLKNYNTIPEDCRPFFSVIVPCYNTKSVNLDLLIQSITCQDFSKEDIELIISDDCSTDTSYFSVIDKYEDQLNILLVSTDQGDVHCPGNNRENAVQYATGEWITFIDHDDMFMGPIFQEAKDAITSSDEKHILCSNILQVDPEDGRVIQEIRYATNWMHGKFYNLDNFWKAYNLHFKKDLISNEDIYISSRVHCILNELKYDKVIWLQEFRYMWKAWSDSLSHSQTANGLSYLEDYFKDYITATYDVYTEEWNRFKEENEEISEEDKMSFARLQVDSIIFQYMYLQYFKYTNADWSLEYEYLVKKNIRDFCARFYINRFEIYDMACSELTNDDTREGGYITKIWYNSVRYSVTVSCGNFIETDSFKDFIENA